MKDRQARLFDCSGSVGDHHAIDSGRGLKMLIVFTSRKPTALAGTSLDAHVLGGSRWLTLD